MRTSRVATLLSLLVASSLLPSSAAFAAPPPPPLGLPCTWTGEWGEVAQNAMAEVEKAVAAAKWEAAIAAQRVLAGDQCDNSYQWYQLAKFYKRAGKTPEAFEVAAYALTRWPNETAAELAQGEDTLGELRAVPRYAESSLVRALAALKAKREERLVKARAAFAALPAAKKPPEQYVAKEACPFECCTFGDWSVEAEIPLYKAPNGAPLGRSLKQGDKVVGLTGEVHLRPRPVVVGYEFEIDDGEGHVTKLPVGSFVFELESIGEGFSNFWKDGKLVTTQLNVYDENVCLELSESCWGDYLDPADTPLVNQWWVKVRLKDGSTAWARDEGFGNMDGCG